MGHIAEACSSDQRLCYNCRQPGHESAACPQPRTVAAKQCYSCGGVGHIQAECPSLRVQGGNQKCYVSPFSLFRWELGSIRLCTTELWAIRTHRACMPEWCCCCSPTACWTVSQYSLTTSGEVLPMRRFEPYVEVNTNGLR